MVAGRVLMLVRVPNRRASEAEMEQETGIDAPSTNEPVKFSYEAEDLKHPISRAGQPIIRYSSIGGR